MKIEKRNAYQILAIFQYYKRALTKAEIQRFSKRYFDLSSSIVEDLLRELIEKGYLKESKCRSYSNRLTTCYSRTPKELYRSDLIHKYISAIPTLREVLYSIRNPLFIVGGSKNNIKTGETIDEADISDATGAAQFVACLYKYQKDVEFKRPIMVPLTSRWKLLLDNELPNRDVIVIGGTMVNIITKEVIEKALLPIKFKIDDKNKRVEKLVVVDKAYDGHYAVIAVIPNPYSKSRSEESASSAVHVDVRKPIALIIAGITAPATNAACLVLCDVLKRQDIGNANAVVVKAILSNEYKTENLYLDVEVVDRFLL
jgi:hypothetical protein